MPGQPDPAAAVRFAIALGKAPSLAELERVFTAGFGRVVGVPMYGFYALSGNFFITNLPAYLFPKSYGFGVSAVWYFTKHWFATSDIAISQLAGDAADSPITRKATNGVFDLSINYEF